MILAPCRRVILARSRTNRRSRNKSPDIRRAKLEPRWNGRFGERSPREYVISGVISRAFRPGNSGHPVPPAAGLPPSAPTRWDSLSISTPAPIRSSSTWPHSALLPSPPGGIMVRCTQITRGHRAASGPSCRGQPHRAPHGRGRGAIPFAVAASHPGATRHRTLRLGPTATIASAFTLAEGVRALRRRRSGRRAPVSRVLGHARDRQRCGRLGR